MGIMFLKINKSTFYKSYLESQQFQISCILIYFVEYIVLKCNHFLSVYWQSYMYYIFSRLCLTSRELLDRSPSDLCHGYPVLCQNKMETHHKYTFWYYNSIENHNGYIYPRPNTGSGQGCREINYLTRYQKTI